MRKSLLLLPVLLVMLACIAMPLPHQAPTPIASSPVVMLQPAPPAQPTAVRPTMLPVQENNFYGIPYDSPEWAIIPRGRDDNPTNFNILALGADVGCKLTINTNNDLSGVSVQKNALKLGAHQWMAAKISQGNQPVGEIYYPDIYPQEYRAGGGVDGNGYLATGFSDNCHEALQEILARLP